MFVACRGEPNNVMIHCRMLDGTAQLQQEALGILGVNLVHGCLAKSGQHYQILAGLMDDLNRKRIEVQPLVLLSKPIGRVMNASRITFAHSCC